MANARDLAIGAAAFVATALALLARALVIA